MGEILELELGKFAGEKVVVNVPEIKVIGVEGELDVAAGLAVGGVGEGVVGVGFDGAERVWILTGFGVEAERVKVGVVVVGFGREGFG